MKSNRNKKIILFERFKKKTIFKKYIYFVYQYFIRLLKPILILDGYFGKKNSLKVTLKSKFKIIFANIDYFDFPRNQITFKKDVKSRSKISIKIKDDFDIIYNEFIKNVLPSSFLENFNTYFTANKKKYLNIS